MNTNVYILNVGSIEAIVIRKNVKNLHLSVLPPMGKVRVTAPIFMKADAIRMLLATRLSWIKKQQAKFRAQERQTPREYVSGETHYYWGKKYRLEVVYQDKPPYVQLKGKNKIILCVRPGSTKNKREQVMMDWYRKELRKVADEVVEYWQNKMDVSLNDWGIRRMKTRWGSCNQDSKRIWLNLELVKKPEHCLHFIIVHELTHILERKHNDRFRAYMDKFLPRWRQIKEELNGFALNHEYWNY
ncbi:M48 family metallopeptidase [bacterium]|nr:M48 family metallopeptidase [bacterium]